MSEDFLKKIQEQFDNLQKNHDVKPDDNFEDEFQSMFSGLFQELDEEVIKMSKQQTLKYKKISKNSIDPKYNYIDDSGFDLHSTQKMEIPAFGRALVPTGISLEIPESFEVQIRPKSGLAINMGITVLNTPGTIDRGYLGEIKVIVFNTNNYTILIEEGMKIAQAVLCPVLSGKYVKLENVDVLGETERGSNGFGSTGII